MVLADDDAFDVPSPAKLMMDEGKFYDIYIDKFGKVAMVDLVGLPTDRELKNHLRGTHISQINSKKPHKNNAVRFTPVLAAGTTCWVIFPLKQSMLGLSFEKGNSNGVKKELFWVKNG